MRVQIMVIIIFYSANYEVQPYFNANDRFPIDSMFKFKT